VIVNFMEKVLLASVMPGVFAGVPWDASTVLKYYLSSLLKNIVVVGHVDAWKEGLSGCFWPSAANASERSVKG